ncbi:PspC domain-containing protein [Fibrella sp. HMF5335]|uniref:PspC domain-containing protein n=1 Tax=Fibrella rubiginis TaxID=2817060 RepID=A0A939GGL8_9BACT|nr:PspC domain-containing protein [Fibrella rubiginis]MBO0936854.1 PspC domain-containing protein [Fibrella rubiginis]
MKKTISINISGVIFHIEEDGYEKLKGYLSSIQQYFSTYEDSQEIVTDIENRIAEKLLKTLKGDDKIPARQAVTIEDINGLIAQMGTVADFEAVDNEDILVASGSRAKTTTASSTSQPRIGTTRAGAYGSGPGAGQTTDGSSAGSSNADYDPSTGKAQTAYDYNGRKLARDLRHKTLGGVAAGLAHYFRIDPVWMRVLLIGLVIGFPALGGALHGSEDFFGSLSGITVLVYIMLWISLPGVTTLEEEKGIKKFYRNPDNKVLGGVASGLAVYFGLDTGVVRFAMVASVFLFGFGVLAYIIVWMVAPEARTLTQKMEMAGQPITLSNIEHSVKSNLNISETAPEGGFTQLLLFPFRAIAAIFQAIGRLLGGTLSGLGNVLRILFGLTMLCMGVGFMITCLVFLGFGVGIINGVHVGPGDDPVWTSLLREDGNFITLLAAFGVGFLPSLGLALTGLLVMTRKALISSSAGLSLLGAWVLCGVILAVTVPQVVSEFSKNGTAEVTQVINPTGTPTFVMDNADDDNNFRPNIELQGYTGNEIKVVTLASARGSSRREAQSQAQLIQYKPVVTDSLVKFSREFLLPDNAKFRGQHVNVTVYIPYGRPFRLSNDAAHFIQNRFDNKEFDNIENKRWQFTSTGLVGIGFERTLDKEDTNNNESDELGDTDDVDVNTDGSETKTLDLGPNPSDGIPRSVAIAGNFAVRFQRGNQLKAVVDGNSQEALANVSHTNEDGTLRIEQRGNDQGQRMGITITLPSLEILRLSGGSEARMTEFDALDKLTIDLSGDSKALVKTNVKTLVADQTGASQLILRGQADKVTAALSGASKLNARQMRVQTADVSATGASRASFDDVKNLTKNTSGASRVDQRNRED